MGENDMFRVLAAMMAILSQWVDHYSGILLLAALAGAVWNHWRLWQRDRLLLRKRATRACAPSFETWPSRPRVSVLVAAWNEAKRIESHITSFQGLAYPNRELIVCAGGADGTYALARRCAGPNVTVIQQRPGEGKQHGLLRCLAHARGEVIYLSDADCEFSDEAFTRLIEPMARGEARVVTGISEPKAEQRANVLVQYQWYTDLLRSHQMPRNVDGLLGRNCALLRSVLESVGGFRAPVRTGTDYHLGKLLLQAGYEIRGVPHSHMATEYADSPRIYLRKWRRWIKNLLIHGYRFRAWKDVTGVLVALVLYSSILVLPLLTPVLGLPAPAVSLLLFGTALANRYRRLAVGARLANRKASWRNALALPFYTVLDMLAVLLAVRDSINPKLRSQW